MEKESPEVSEFKHARQHDSRRPAPLGRCVGDVDEFVSQVWGQRPARFEGQGPFDDLLSIRSIEEWLQLTARRPSFRLVRDGATISPTEYTTTIRMGGANVSDVADISSIKALLETGATLVLQGLERTHAPLQRFTAALRAEISHPVQANAYLSPPSTRGLKEHSDDHDVLILQVNGTKRWDVDGLGVLDINAGDVVYIPRATQHYATTNESLSLHITIGISAVTVRDVIRRSLNRPNSSLDRPLPIGYGASGDALARIVADGLVSASRQLAAVDPAMVADAERQRVSGPHPRALLTAYFASFAIDDATTIQLTTTTTPRVLYEDATITLHLSDRTIRIPAAARSAIEKILLGDPVTVAELPGLNHSSRTVIARRLLREGVIDLSHEST
ncbi:MAG: cupin domain-containing protein [Ilumatobacteraceae bacterium]